MSSVDNRVVQMQFDNKQFESGIKTSLDSLEQLDKSIHAAGSSKGMTGLSTAVETVQARFSALQVIAVTALANITNSAVNAGKKLLSSLTIDPVKTGLSEYETQINAVQTILANTESKGTTLDQVNSALDTLNAYADKTIYNFTEMTRNIGTFTAAGVDLDTSVNAIQGIANLAAVSGSNSQQASTAMYQLSQALSSGVVKLMDWNSVTNAGMGGQVFQDALKETARVSGVAIDEMIEKEGSFRESLKNGWLTAEILTDTLQKFTLTTEGLTEAQIEENRAMLKSKGYTDEQIEAIFKLGNTATQAATKVKTFSQLLDTTKEAAQSGWTQSWEIVVGDFEEAKLLWTNVSNIINDIIGASANARNEMLKSWKDLGGRTALIEALSNVFDGFVNLVTPIKEVFRELFPPTTGKQLYDITTGFKALTESFKKWTENAENIDKIKRTFKGLFAVLSIGKQLLGAVFKVFKTVLGITGEAAGGFLGVTASIGDFLVAIDKAIKGGNVFGVVADKISTVLLFIIKGVKNFVSAIASVFKGFANIDTSGVDAFTDKVKDRFEPLTALGEGIKKVFNVILAVLKKAAPVFLTLAGFIGDALGALGDAIMGALKSGDFSAVLDIINGVLTGGLLYSIKEFIDSLSDSIGIFSGIGDVLEGFTMKLKAGALLKIAGAIAILAASFLVLSLIDSEKLTGAMTAITGLFVELFTAMTIFSKVIDGKGFKGVTKITTAMLGLSISVLILASAMNKLAKLDWEGLSKGLVGVAALSAILVASAKVLSSSGKKMMKGATGLIALSVAILILTKAVEKLGKLDVGSLTKGLVGVGVLCAELALFLKMTDLDGMGLLKGLGLMALAQAVNILATAVGKFGSLNVNSLIKGLGAMTIVLAELAIFVNVTGNAKKVTSTATGLVILGSAMLIMANAIGKMGSFSWEQIGKGLLTMASALTIMGVAMKLIPKSTIITATGLVVLSSALVILSKALANMGGMSWEEVGKGLTTLAGSLTLIVAAMHLMKGALSGAAALLVISTALAIFAPVLRSFGNMSWEEIGRGLLTLAGVFGVFGVAALVLSPITPIMLALGAAIALLGVGCAAVGAGLLAFSAGLSALAVSGVAGAAALVTVIATILGIIPMVLKAIGAGIIAILDLIADSASSICAAVTAVLLAVIGALKTAIPPLIECLGMLLDTLLKFIIAYVPKIVDAGMRLIIALLKGIANKIDDVVAAAVSIVTEFLTALGEELPKIVDAGFEMIISFIDGITKSIKENGPRLQESCKNLGVAIIDGLTGGLYSKLIEVKKTIENLGKNIIEWIKEKLGIHSPSTVFASIGKNTIQGFINGFKSLIPNALSSIKNFAANGITNVKNKFAEWGSAGKTAIANFASGVREKVSGAVSTVRNFASNCVTAIKNKVSNFASTGRNAISNFASGVKSRVSSVTSAASNVASKCVTSVKNGISGFTTAGKNAVGGFISGVKSNITAAANAAWDVGKKALSSIKNALGIHSPSREFAEVGMYSDEGLAGGLKKFAGVVGKSATDVGKTAVESLKTPMEKISDILGSDMNAEPTIRPVLDLSQVQAGSSQLSNLFGQQTVALAGVNAGIMIGNTSALADIAAQMQKVNDAGNTDIVDAITGLRQDFNSLSEAVSKMKVVMDTGVLVGEIIPGVDSGLGQIAIHKGRGN